MSPIVRNSPLLSFKSYTRTKVEDTAVVCECVCICVARGWRLREGGGVVGNRSVLQMLQGRRTEWKLLRLSAPWKQSLTLKGMPRVAPSQTLRCRFALVVGGTEKLVVPSDRWV